MFLTDPLVVRKILEQLGLETAPLPLAPARVGERGLRLWTWDGSEIAAEAGARSQSVEPEVGDSGEGLHPASASTLSFPIPSALGR